ncbi:MAG: AtpZ/AtpI family protein [Pirellulaceae bacterium]
MALAMEWVAKITTVGLIMVLPAVGGQYLDTRLGTKYWAVIGLGVGMTAGLVHLLQITRRPHEPPLAAEELLDKDRQDPSGERTRKQ